MIKFRTLKSKFLFFSVGGTLVFAILISWMVHWNYRNNMTAELRRRADVLSSGLSASLHKAVLTENKSLISQITNEYKQIDKDIVYIFITDLHGDVVYHTFDSGFPEDLLELAKTCDNTTSIETEFGPIEEVSKGMIGGKAGCVHIGISSAKIKHEILLNLQSLILILVIIWVAGLAVISYLASSVTKPILKVIDASRKLGEGENNIRIEVDTEDETGQLAQAFNSMADSLDENQRRVLQAEKLAAIGRLVAGVAHEINNPIMGIRNSFDLIKRMDDTPEKAKKYIGLIEESLTGVEKIVRELLSFSRQKQEPLKTFTPKEVIEKSIDFIEHLSKKKDVNIRFDYCSEHCMPVYGAPDELRQVIMNMIVNSLDAMPDGGEIKISTHCSDGTDFAEITISDQGTGIPDDARDKIFEPFYTTKDVSKGTGLGLYVCHEIVARMGGSISVESNPERGTQFTIKLPVCKGEQ